MIDRAFSQMPFVLVLCGSMVVAFFLAPPYAADLYGLVPRSHDHLVGIMGFHFLHGGIWHLTANLSGLASLSILLAATHKSPWLVVIVLMALSGGLLWMFGEPFDGPHIGASALVAALVGYLIARGVSKMDGPTLIVGLIVLFFFGVSTFHGVDPALGAQGISWEGHLAGAVAGFIYGTFDRG